MQSGLSLLKKYLEKRRRRRIRSRGKEGDDNGEEE